MAVQAQYPSNVLFSNRTIQEGKNPLGNDDYSLQPQPGGGSFLDHTKMLFNPGGGSNNSCKRRREITSMNPIMSPMQSQPQLIDLSQLHKQQPNVVSTGLHLAFGEQQQQQQLKLHHQHSVSPQSSQQSSALYSVLTEDLSSLIKQQRDEIDQFLHLQREQLRRTLEEKRQKHYRAIIRAAEDSLSARLSSKQAELDHALHRHGELSARAAQLRAEADAWQARARAEELTAARLQARLHQAMINDEAEAEAVAEDAESAYVDPDRVTESTGPSCKGCTKRVASVVILPCRHLCVCSECDAVIQSCPLCLSVKNSSVEVFLC